MTIISKNIRYLRLKNEWSQDYIAEKLGYKSYTTIQKWEMSASEPPLKIVKQLADLFKIGIDDLTNIDLEISNKTNEKTSKGICINVLGRVDACFPIEAVENIIDTEEISEDMAKNGEYFGLQIHGDSMEPRMYEGDVVIVRQQDDAESGDIVIAMINGNDATCKRLSKYASGIALTPLNTKYEPMIFTNQEILEKPIKIIGKVVELRGSYKNR